MKHWQTTTFEAEAMGTKCTIQIDGSDEKLVRKAASEAITEILRIEQKFSRHRPDSVTRRINQRAGIMPVSVDEETRQLIDLADELFKLSSELLDVSSGVLMKGWDFVNARMPEPEELVSLLRLVGWKRVKVKNGQIYLPIPGMELDLDAIARSYATDRAAVVLKAYGLEHSLVKLGGDCFSLGNRGIPELSQQPWRLPIQHPRQQPGALNLPVATLPLSRGGLSTRGDFEHYFEQNGKRYCDILNPHTGLPVSYWQSITTKAINATTANALSTIATLKGAHAPKWLEDQGAEFLAIRYDGQIYRSASTPLKKSLPTLFNPVGVFSGKHASAHALQWA